MPFAIENGMPAKHGDGKSRGYERPRGFVYERRIDSVAVSRERAAEAGTPARNRPALLLDGALDETP